LCAQVAFGEVKRFFFSSGALGLIINIFLSSIKRFPGMHFFYASVPSLEAFPIVFMEQYGFSLQMGRHSSALLHASFSGSPQHHIGMSSSFHARLPC
jgi:hypothetical protein